MQRVQIKVLLLMPNGSINTRLKISNLSIFYKVLIVYPLMPTVAIWVQL